VTHDETTWTLLGAVVVNVALVAALARRTGYHASKGVDVDYTNEKRFLDARRIQTGPDLDELERLARAAPEPNGKERSPEDVNAAGEFYIAAKLNVLELTQRLRAAEAIVRDLAAPHEADCLITRAVEATKP
jgi:hypothetical protein